MRSWRLGRSRLVGESVLEVRCPVFAQGGDGLGDVRCKEEGGVARGDELEALANGVVTAVVKRFLGPPQRQGGFGGKLSRNVERVGAQALEVGQHRVEEAAALSFRRFEPTPGHRKFTRDPIPDKARQALQGAKIRDDADVDLLH